MKRYSLLIICLLAIFSSSAQSIITTTDGCTYSIKTWWMPEVKHPIFEEELHSSDECSNKDSLTTENRYSWEDATSVDSIRVIKKKMAGFLFSGIGRGDVYLPEFVLDSIGHINKQLCVDLRQARHVYWIKQKDTVAITVSCRLEKKWKKYEGEIEADVAIVGIYSRKETAYMAIIQSIRTNSVSK